MTYDEEAVDDLRRRLEQAPLAPPTTWRPAVGALVIGRVVRYRSYLGRYGPCWSVTLDVGDGQAVLVWLGHQDLRRQIQEWRPAPGETLGIRRLADGVTGAGGACYRYTVRVAGRRPELEALPDPEDLDEPPALPAGDGR